MTDENRNNNGPDSVEVTQAVSDKLEKVDDALRQNSAQPVLTARQECYKRIVELVKQSLTSYYTRFPDRAVDERARDEEDWLVRRIRDTLLIIDDYNISYKTEDKT